MDIETPTICMYSVYKLKWKKEMGTHSIRVCCKGCNRHEFEGIWENLIT